MHEPIRLLYTEPGVVIVLAQVQMPLMVLPILTVLSRIDPNLADASRVLGAGEWRTLWRITIPLSLPGVIAGCILTYTACITAFVTQTLIGGARLIYMPLHIYQKRSAPTTGRLRRRSRSSSWWQFWSSSRCSAALGRRSETYAQALSGRSTWEAGSLRSCSPGDSVAMVFLVAPTVIVLLTSFTASESLKFPPSGLSLRWYYALLDADQMQRAAWNSLVVAFWTTLICVSLGTAASLAIARSRSRWVRSCDMLFMSPLFLPALAFGFAALVYINKLGFSPSISPSWCLAMSWYACRSFFAPRWRHFRSSIRRCSTPPTASAVRAG